LINQNAEHFASLNYLDKYRKKGNSQFTPRRDNVRDPDPAQHFRVWRAPSCTSQHSQAWSWIRVCSTSCWFLRGTAFAMLFPAEMIFHCPFQFLWRHKANLQLRNFSLTPCRLPAPMSASYRHENLYPLQVPATETPGNHHVAGWIFGCHITLGTVWPPRPFPALCPMLIASSGAASLLPRLGRRAPSCPLLHPTGLGVFSYGGQAPADASLRASWGQGDGAGSWHLFLQKGRDQGGRCSGSAKPREAGRTRLRDAASGMRRHRAIKRSCQEQMAPQACSAALQQSLPRTGGTRGAAGFENA